MEKLEFDTVKYNLVKKIMSFINENGHYAELGHTQYFCEISAIINDRKYLIDVLYPIWNYTDSDELEGYTYMLVNSLDDFIQQLLINLVIKKI